MYVSWHMSVRFLPRVELGIRANLTFLPSFLLRSPLVIVVFPTQPYSVAYVACFPSPSCSFASVQYSFRISGNLSPWLVSHHHHSSYYNCPLIPCSTLFRYPLLYVNFMNLSSASLSLQLSTTFDTILNSKYYQLWANLFAISLIFMRKNIT